MTTSYIGLKCKACKVQLPDGGYWIKEGDIHKGFLCRDCKYPIDQCGMCGQEHRCTID